MSKLVAILGGSDWYDASVDFLSVPDNFDEKRAQRDYAKWLEGFRAGTMDYLSFAEWLRQQGATEANDEQIEVWES